MLTWVYVLERTYGCFKYIRLKSYRNIREIWNFANIIFFRPVGPALSGKESLRYD